MRSALERSSLDHGSVSVHDKMVSMGLQAPSSASLARVLRAEGIARTDASKRPHARRGSVLVVKGVCVHVAAGAAAWL